MVSWFSHLKFCVNLCCKFSLVAIWELQQLPLIFFLPLLLESLITLEFLDWGTVTSTIWREMAYNSCPLKVCDYQSSALPWGLSHVLLPLKFSHQTPFSMPNFPKEEEGRTSHCQWRGEGLLVMDPADFEVQVRSSSDCVWWSGDETDGPVLSSMGS